MTSDPPAVPQIARISVGSSPRLIAVVPHLLGFEPRNSLVVIGTSPPRDRVRVTLRYDLPDPVDLDLAADLASHAVSVLTGQRLDGAIALGYGPEALVDPVAGVLTSLLAEAGVTLHDILRVHDGRFWSYFCDDKTCRSDDGTPIDPDLTVEGAEFLPRVLPVRDDIAAGLAPFTGHVADEVARVYRGLVRTERDRDVPKRERRGLGKAGLQSAIGVYRDGGHLEDPGAIAFLLWELSYLEVRDDAWARMDPDHRQAHIRLWTDMLRFAGTLPAAAPAGALLAFCAWQAGNGALANCALDRALAADPDYSMALLLRQIIGVGAPPSLARLPMTPDEVAASYDSVRES